MTCMALYVSKVTERNGLPLTLLSYYSSVRSFSDILAYIGYISLVLLLVAFFITHMCTKPEDFSASYHCPNISTRSESG